MTPKYILCSTCGKLVKNTVIEGNTVNSNGEWAVNGVVQTK